MRCTGCGAPVDKDSAFCERCGSAVPKPQQPQAQHHHHYYHNQQSQQQPPLDQIQFQTPQQPQAELKSKTVTVLLAFFLGLLGAHNFYLGFVGRGIVQFILTISIIGIFISSIWSTIEFFTILFSSNWQDARGRPLRG